MLLEVHGPLGDEVALDLHAVHWGVRRGLEELVERERGAGRLAEGGDALRVEGVQREVEEDLGARGALAVQQGVDLRGVGRAGLEGHRRGYRGGHWRDHGRECHPGGLGETGVGASSLVREHGCGSGLGGKRDDGRERGDYDRRRGEGDRVWRRSEAGVPGWATLTRRERLTLVIEANAPLGGRRRNDGGGRKTGHGRDEG